MLDMTEPLGILRLGGCLRRQGPWKADARCMLSRVWVALDLVEEALPVGIVGRCACATGQAQHLHMLG